MPTDAPHSLPAFLVVEKDYAVYRPEAMVSFETALKMVETAMNYCVENDVKRLLLDATGLTGFKPPTLADRYHDIDRWANISRGKLRIAEIDRPEQLDPTGTNVVIAENRGLDLKVFTEEKEAVEWLLR